MEQEIERISQSADAAVLYKAFNVVNRLAVELDIHAAVDAVRIAALELLDCDRVTLFALVKSRRELRGRTGGAAAVGGAATTNNTNTNSDEGIDVPIRLAYGEGVAGYVAVTGETVNLADAYEESVSPSASAASASASAAVHFNREVDRCTGYRTRSLLCCPIRDASGKIVAVLQALNKKAAGSGGGGGGGGCGNANDTTTPTTSGVFTATDELLLRLVGMHLGNALARSRLQAAAQRERERLAALGRCFKRLSGGGGQGAGSSLRGALDTVAEAAREVVRAEQVVIFLADTARGELWTSLGEDDGQGEGEGEVRALRTRFGEGLVGRCASERRQISVCVPLPQQQPGGALAEEEDELAATTAKARTTAADDDAATATATAAATTATAAATTAATAAHAAPPPAPRPPRASTSSPGQQEEDPALVAADALAARRDPLLMQLLSALGWPSAAAAAGGAAAAAAPSADADAASTSAASTASALPAPPPMWDLLLQPVLDPSTGACLAVLAALNSCGPDRAAAAAGRRGGKAAAAAATTTTPPSLFDDDCFTPGDRQAMAMLSNEVADVLSARALEVSFASALSVVAERSGSGAVGAPGLAARLRAQLLDFADAGGPRVQAAAAGAAAAGRAGGLLMSPLLARGWSLSTTLPRGSGRGAAAANNAARADGTTGPGSNNSHARGPFASGAAVAAAAATMRSRDLTAIDLALSGGQHDAARAVATAVAAGGNGGGGGGGKQGGGGTKSSSKALLEAAAAAAAAAAPPRPMDGCNSLSSAGSDAWDSRAAATAYRALAAGAGPSAGGGDAAAAAPAGPGSVGGTAVPSSTAASLGGSRAPSSALGASAYPAAAAPEGALPPLNGSSSLSRFASLQHSLPAMYEEEGGSGDWGASGGGGADAFASPPSQQRMQSDQQQPRRPSMDFLAPAAFAQQQQQQQQQQSSSPPRTAPSPPRSAPLPERQTTAPAAAGGAAAAACTLGPNSSNTNNGNNNNNNNHNHNNNIRDWALDCSEMPRERLVRVAATCFSLSAAARGYPLPDAAIASFLSAVASHYRSPEQVPYHNFGHVVQVLHTAWLLLESSPKCRAALRPVDELSLLVAAICHDLDHDGRSNAFHVNAGTELAMRYNDRSVMENHHCALAFAILRSRAGKGVFAGFSADEARSARRTLCESILSTDMVCHYALTRELQEHGPDFSPATDADRMLLVRVLLHGCDIGGPVRSFGVAARWSRRVHEEFGAQARLEREMGLPVTAAAAHEPGEEEEEESEDEKEGQEGQAGGGDEVAEANRRRRRRMRAAASLSSAAAARADMETHFIDYVVAPLWERLAQCFAPEMDARVAAMRANRERFAAMAAGELDLEAPA